MSTPSINSRYRRAERREEEEEDDDREEILNNGLDDVIITDGGCNNSNAPLDKYNYNYIVFYLLGMTTLLPWNFFVTAEDVSGINYKISPFLIPFSSASSTGCSNSATPPRMPRTII